MPRTLTAQLQQPEYPECFRNYPEAASQDFPAMFPVKWNSGQLVELVDPAVDANITTANTGLVGVSGRKASGVTGALVPTYKITKSHPYVVLPLYDSGTPADAIYNNTVRGATYVGRIQDGVFCVNIDTGTSGVFIVDDFCGNDPTETYAPVRVRVVDDILHE